MEELSPRQREILEYIVSAVEQRGVPPSYREIGAALDIGSTNAVSDHIKALMKKGYLERVGAAGNPRSVKPTLRATGNIDDDRSVGVPIIGRIAAGTPLLAEENYEGSIRVDRDMLPAGGKVFVLVVTGESMIGDGIHDGDLLFVKEQTTFRNGEITVVLVGGEATVKRVFREEGRLRLQPSNPAMSPRWVDDQAGECSIIGVAVGLYRRIG